MKSVFGRYIPGNSFLYKLDPRIKLLIALLYIILAFLISNFIDMFIILAPAIIAYIYSTKKIRPLIKLMKLPFFICIIIFFVNIYTINSEIVIKDDYFKEYFKVLVQTNKTINGVDTIVKYGLSLNNLNRVFALFLRIYTMILITTLLTNTTRPILLNKSIEDLMWPLKFLFVPTHIIATIISIALRFIPTLVDEAGRIIKAQSSRGVDFKRGKFKEKIIAFTTLIIPLFVSSFQKADDLSNSMETRGYDPYEKRTKYRQIKPRVIDIILFIVILLVFSFLILNYLNLSKGIDINIYDLRNVNIYKYIRIVG
ncbi:energy-coupling factor transporter transmembrane protein EcfT [Mycoplasma sp. CSL10137]|uniref:energy-coupling factor transporter transmembrane component T family protein n=1 Tax=unclassified Mycoplasma TaxID=2683645 RepID=UPI00197C9A94|nr:MULTISPECIES: energy-coupling factor transporter transmembrane component T [unclassified Mycoplasma]MBN4083720.1 energy-coupling factor transporter transmembrane protein EcfT [Mycoplasma sp. CSL10137]MBN4084647.1 energy-coupling factor transporter transmembrane protein EcfT [Mycoplasma sp. CSL10166]